jgi:GTP-binding protein EngB required for normal cell division
MNPRRPATADRERRIKLRRPGSAAAEKPREDAGEPAGSADQVTESAGQAAEKAGLAAEGTAARAGGAHAAGARAPGEGTWIAPDTAARLAAGRGWAGAGTSPAKARADADAVVADALARATAAAGTADQAAAAAPAAPDALGKSRTGQGRRPLPVRVSAAAPAPPRTPARPGSGGGQGQHALNTAGADVVPRRPEPPLPQETISGLSARLMALARMIQIGSARGGRDGFRKKLLTDAEEVLARAGDRMRLSSGHTVVALAGGTGSGKSSLFNKIAGAEFSTVGVTRPVTVHAHACVWGEPGSGAILDWLNIPGRARYSRASALDGGEDTLAGLVLLDLPDHDSVMNHAGALVDRLVNMADVMIWVLDPQKYADAAVHRRFLVPMAGHSDVLAVVLNQIDVLDPEQVDDCIADLRRLLDSEDLQDVSILVTSAVTGEGLDDLRTLLTDGVAARRAAAARISADLDRVVARFEPYAGDVDAPVGRVPVTSKARLADRFASAAGITAVGDALKSARELRAADFVGWPVAWFAQRLSGRNPLRKVRLGTLWNDLRSVTAGPAGAQQAEIDNALTDLGTELAEPLPVPWSHTVKAAVRSEAEQIPAALGAAIGGVLPDEDSVVWWWRFAGVWQGLLLGAAAVAIAWIALVLAFGVFHAASGLPAVLTDTGALPWIVALAVAALALGAATASICMRLVVSTAEHENTQVTAAMKERVAVVAAEMVVVPAEQELAELERYREEARIAERGLQPSSSGRPLAITAS